MKDDLPVIERVLHGDRESFRLLVEKYQQPLFCFVRNLLVDANDCDDITQEVFLTAYTHLRAYDARRATFSTWLFTIARNQCLNALKKRRPRPLDEVPEQADPHTPEQALSEEESFRQLDAALARLPVDQRTAFVLAEIQGLSEEDIAKIEGVARGTVKSRISRARQKLRSFFEHIAEPR